MKIVDKTLVATDGGVSLKLIDGWKIELSIGDLMITGSANSTALSSGKSYSLSASMVVQYLKSPKECMEFLKTFYTGVGEYRGSIFLRLAEEDVVDGLSELNRSLELRAKPGVRLFKEARENYHRGNEKRTGLVIGDGEHNYFLNTSDSEIESLPYSTENSQLTNLSIIDLRKVEGRKEDVFTFVKSAYASGSLNSISSEDHNAVLAMIVSGEATLETALEWRSQALCLLGEAETEDEKSEALKLLKSMLKNGLVADSTISKQISKFKAASEERRKKTLFLSQLAEKKFSRIGRGYVVSFASNEFYYVTSDGEVYYVILTPDELYSEYVTGLAEQKLESPSRFGLVGADKRTSSQVLAILKQTDSHLALLE